jgi:YidC/Oxa1 family membrane protein insertase
MIQTSPGFPVGPIATFLGWFMNFFYDMVAFMPATLIISVILLTIFSRICMLPLGIKSQKSMLKMQMVAPEVEKIKKKYQGATDPAMKRKRDMEIQQLYSAHKISVFGGCLPLLIQLPIFFALSFMIQNSFMYVNKIDEMYNNISVHMMQFEVDEDGQVTGGASDAAKAALFPLAQPKIPRNLELDPNDPRDITRILNKFVVRDFEQFKINYNDFLMNDRSNAERFVEDMLHAYQEISDGFIESLGDVTLFMDLITELEERDLALFRNELSRFLSNNDPNILRNIDALLGTRDFTDVFTLLDKALDEFAESSAPDFYILNQFTRNFYEYMVVHEFNYVVIDEFWQFAEDFVDYYATAFLENEFTMFTDHIEGTKKMLEAYSIRDFSVFAPIYAQFTASTEVITERDFTHLDKLLADKASVETVFGINTKENAGLGFPGILFPLLVGFSSFMQSFIMQRQNKANQTDQQKTQNKIMLIVLPIMMTFFTISFPIGVAIYWITTTVFAIAQQIVLYKIFMKDGNKLLPAGGVIEGTVKEKSVNPFKKNKK